MRNFLLCCTRYFSSFKTQDKALTIKMEVNKKISCGLLYFFVCLLQLKHESVDLPLFVP